MRELYNAFDREEISQEFSEVSFFDSLKKLTIHLSCTVKQIKKFCTKHMTQELNPRVVCQPPVIRNRQPLAVRNGIL